MIVGIDEVGRGCLAGPVVAGAVILKGKIRGIKDSKKLTKEERERFDKIIRKKALAIGIGWVSPQEIDDLGMTEAVRLAMYRALAEISHEHDYSQIIIDGNYNYLAHLPESVTMIKADDKIPAVSAASIVAKVARDHWMATIAATQHPQYGFESHVGYGTPRHCNAIEDHGICDLHRRLFAPVKMWLPEHADQL